MSDTLNERQRFKLGFMLRCVDEGLDEQQIRERVKVARVLTGIDKEAIGIGALAIGGGLAYSGSQTSKRNRRKEQQDAEDEHREMIDDAHEQVLADTPLEKRAIPGAGAAANAVLGIPAAALKTVAWGFPVAALGGVTSGYLAGKMTENDIDPEDQKTQELIAAYDLHADRARRARERKARLRPRKAPVEQTMPGGPALI